MRQCLLLFLSAGHLHAQHMVGGKIATQREFSDSPAGRDDFSSFLQEFKCPTYMLVDLIEEDFRQESVPHLSGSTRSALLQRKFEQFYRGTIFHLATLLQRQKTGRRDDDMLFSALTNPVLITPWLDTLLARQTPLAGIYSVPQISAPLAKGHASNHLLLISWERHAGLRQSYFSGHHLQISRLTPAHGDLPFHDAVVDELTRTYQYLKSLSLLPQGQILDVRILCHAVDRQELQARLPNGADMRYEFTDIAELGKQLDIDYEFTDSDASQIFLHQLATHPPATSYAHANHTHYFDLWQLRLTFNWISGVMLAGSLLWAAANIWQGSGDANEAGSIQAQAQHASNEAQRLIRTFPVDPDLDSATDIKTSVLILRKIEQYGPIPQSIFVPVSQALDRHPEIQIDELAWRMNANEPATPNSLADAPATIIHLKGRLEESENNYRLALDHLEQFERDLAGQGYQVTALEKPLDISPGGSLADQRDADQNPFAFALKISRGPAS